ncbi:EmrB/QacA subfamily drug resistance transporter [Paenibacillus anaericanus]|uniref:MDR family MFS transporter n=1 Tax=Paenibacillus anaericanus TaxID=170367 RepID=UPI00278180C6|nr:MDR family MFS transporter [Paenibacillus anaericanus]MDQ0089476.1 EmrB/QacA subfamily drug resistance transporter [Paenibacillus anaericanus]
MPSERSKTRLITIGLLLGLFLSSLDQTIISTAMPTVIKELGGFSLYSWVFTIYMLASTTTMPIYGKLADLFGRRRMYLIGIFIFLVGSTLCGIAGSMTELIIYRGIQGLGAGALMPISMTIVADIYPPETRGKFMGLFGAVFAVTSIFGPALGGLIVEHWNWGWIFYMNLVIGIPALIIIAIAMEESKSTEKRSIDWLGALTLSGGIIAILLALVLGGEGQGVGMSYAWGSTEIIGLFSLGTVLLGVFLWIEMKVKEPIIPLHLFKIREIGFGNMVGFFMSAGLFGAIVYIPLFVQGVIGVNSSISGFILAPLMLSVIVTSTLAGRLMSMVSYRTILIPSMVLMTIGFVLLSQITVDTTKIEIIVYMIVAGLGMGSVYPTIGTAAQSAVDRNMRGVATSSSQFFRSIGGTIGVSVFGSLMSQQMTSGINELSVNLESFPADQLDNFTNPQILLDSAASASLPHEVLMGLRNVFSNSIDHLFLGAVIFVLIGLIASFFMGDARLVGKNKVKEQKS